MARVITFRSIAVGVLLAVLAVCAVVAWRAVAVPSRQVAVQPLPEQPMDAQALAQRLAAAIRFRTVSTAEDDSPEATERAAFTAWLAGSYPHVHRVLRQESVGGSLLYTWEGRDPERPALLLLAHLDVVPVDGASQAQWKFDPFAGVIAEGFVWGRGALDDKGSLIAILEAAEQLIAEGFQPRQTLLFAFGHDEEIGGAGAQAVARRLAARGPRIETVLDEGGLIGLELVPGVAAPVALVGIAEKGYVSVTLRAAGEGGHSSMPPPLTPVGRVARAVERLQRRPFPARLGGPTRHMFEHLAAEMSPALRTVAANLWLFGPLIEWRAGHAPGLNAALRTTTAPTVISGGVKENVIAPAAEAVVNFRLLPGDSVEGVLARVRAVIDDPHLHIEAGQIQVEPSAVSDPAAPSFTHLSETIRVVFPEAVVAPYLVVGATDARHYAALSPHVYRFLPVHLRGADLKRIHGIDERIAVADYLDAVRFYRTLMSRS